MQPQDWFAETFEGDYLRIYAHQAEPQRLEKEAWELVRALDLAAGDAVLDCPCGFGRHSLVLARAGFRVTGADLSQPFLKLAREAAARDKLDAQFVESDMRALPEDFSGRFDGAFSAFTSFGFFDAEADNQKVLDELARAVKPGGRVLIDVRNHLQLIDHEVPRVWFRGQDCVVLEEITYNWRTDQIVNKREVRFDDGRVRKLPAFRVRAYKPYDLLRMAESAGLKAYDLAGGFSGQPFEPKTSNRIVLVAEKP